MDNLERNIEIETELMELLPHFESFFNRVGFKRIDGAIFGLLTFSKTPLSSVQIEKTLGLSQSAVSLSLKTLTQYAMIENFDHPEVKRQKLHKSKDDALEILTNVIQKRELEYLRDFEKMNIKSLEIIKDDIRQKRMQGILHITRFAKSLSEVLIDLREEIENPYPVIEKFPQIVTMLKTNLPMLSQAKDQLSNQISSKLKKGISSWLQMGESR